MDSMVLETLPPVCYADHIHVYLLLKDDIERWDLNRAEMIAKLLFTLETTMYRTMQEKQYSAVASNAKFLMKLIGL